ncbi:MAG: MaoC family dehydratase [Acidimicrobiia bacterium]|nr:MaoC family dehydratase [Acidimicrobiia bacterium]
MGMEELQGRVYRRKFRADRSTISAFIEATGDDPARWPNIAPPGLAAAAVFAVAPAFLFDPDVGEFSRILIHADQTFRWLAPWETGADYAVTGTVDRVRMRGGAAWVTFSVGVVAAGNRVLDSTSTFVMSDQRPDSEVAERNEPGPLERADEIRPVSYPSSGELPETVRSASRADLIRYAAASRDFNPLHWDHETARNAGLPGVVVHGLLMASWMLQTATAIVFPSAGRPIHAAKFRFRNPLFPGEAASITGAIGAAPGPVSLELTSNSGPLVGGLITVER